MCCNGFRKSFCTKGLPKEVQPKGLGDDQGGVAEAVGGVVTVQVEIQVEIFLA
jgi:hypothetical protein